MFSNYGPLCTTVYQLTKPIGSSLNGDVDYYIERLKGVALPILEIGVGTGRMMIPLLATGLDISGIDISPDMLALCNKNLTDHSLNGVTEHLNFCTDKLPKKYGAIIIPTATFNLITDYQAAIQGLSNIYNSLLPGGRLILDLDLPFYPEVGEIHTAVYPLDAHSGITTETKTLEIDWFNQLVVNHLKYDKWENGSLVASELQNFTLKWYGINEFTDILTKVGFINVTVSADYDYLEAPTDANQTITFECTKSV